MSRMVAFVVGIIGAPADLLADTPRQGTLIGQTAGDILQYSCSEIEGNNISCDFMQIILSPKATEEEWPEKLEKLRTEYLKGEFNSIAFCDNVVEPINRYFNDGMPADTSPYNTSIMDFQPFAEQLEYELEFLTKYAKAGDRYCDSRDFEELSAFYRLLHERELEICEPTINQYSQRYAQSTNNQWVVSEPPAGVCGIVNTSRFVRDDDDGFLNAM